MYTECIVSSDRDTCCDQLCTGGIRCPLYYVTKPNNSALRCNSTCDLEEDIEACCDAAASCSNYTCPDSYVHKSSPPQEFCSGLLCDPAVDLERCCNQGCGTLVCPAPARHKLAAENLSCAGTCDLILDVQTCCDSLPGLNSSAQLLRAAVVSDVHKVDRLVTMRAEVADKAQGFDTSLFSGSSALHLGALNGHSDIVRRLLRAGYDCNARDDLQWVPLHVAAGRGHSAVVTDLLAWRADPLMRNLDGELPRDVASRSALEPGQVELLLARGERRRTQELHDAAVLHANNRLLEALPVQLGLKAWLTADVAGGVELAADGTLSRWVDQTGRGNDGVPLRQGGLPPPTMGELSGYAAVRFRHGQALQGASAAACRTVALVIQFRAVSHSSSLIFADLSGQLALRLSDPVRGFWRDRPKAGRGLTKHDWQHRQADKVWLNGNNVEQTWEGFPLAPVVLVAVKRAGVADGDDFVFRIAGGGRGFDGLIGEVLTYDRELAKDEVLELSAHLSRKWATGLHRRADEL